jgi:hypothetical protein
MMRGAAVIDVIRPKLPALSVVFGFPQLMLFVRLKVSSRSSSVCVPIAISRDSAMSIAQKPGPGMLFRS